MNKKLLLTTALIGTLSVLGTANAELKIGAHVKTAWKSMEGFATGAPSGSGFTQERQIDLSSSGTLNNGWAYKAGFSLEQDANETGFDGSETLYIGVSPSAGTLIQIGTDGAPLNGDYNIVPRAGNAMNEEIGNGNATTVQASAGMFATNLKYAQDSGTIKSNAYINVTQDIPTGKIAVTFAPNSKDKMNLAADTTVQSNQDGGSGFEINYAGKPLPNLDVYLAAMDQNCGTVSGTTCQKNASSRAIGFAYTMGTVKAGAELVKNDNVGGGETTMKEYGVVFKLSDNATAGIGRTVTSGKLNNGVKDGTEDETVTYLQVGYNLGAIGTQLSYIDGNALGYTATNDSKALVLKVNTKF